jgi:hypothetical protein
MKAKTFNDPDLLWTAASKYFLWCEKHPLIKEEMRGAKKVKLKKIRPFTWGGLAAHLGCSVMYLRQLHSNKRFADVMGRIYDVIYVQLFEGAAVGVFNADLVIPYLKLEDNHTINLTSDLK